MMPVSCPSYKFIVTPHQEAGRKMVIPSSKMLAGFHMAIYQYIPGDRTVHFHHFDNLKFNKLRAN